MCKRRIRPEVFIKVKPELKPKRLARFTTPQRMQTILEKGSFRIGRSGSSNEISEIQKGGW